MCLVLCAGEPDGSEHYVSYDSKTLKEAAFRLEQPSSCFYQTIISKGGRVARGDADRKYRAGAHDAVALSLVNNIPPKLSAMGLPDGILKVLVKEGFSGGYQLYLQHVETNGLKIPTQGEFKSWLSYIDSSVPAINQAVESFSLSRSRRNVRAVRRTFRHSCISCSYTGLALRRRMCQSSFQSSSKSMLS